MHVFTSLGVEVSVDLELVFSAASLVAMLGWVTLLASPRFPAASQIVAGGVIPVLLAAGYAGLALHAAVEGPAAGGFSSLAEVAELFSDSTSLLAGWIHFLAFDLLVGAWICRTAAREEVRFWWVVPCLFFDVHARAGWLPDLHGVALDQTRGRAGGPRLRQLA